MFPSLECPDTRKTQSFLPRTNSHLINSPERPVEVAQGLKPSSICTLYAALKRRSSTVVRADGATEGRALPEPSSLLALGGTTERRALPEFIYEMLSSRDPALKFSEIYRSNTDVSRQSF
jgi:hypothetical protein